MQSLLPTPSPGGMGFNSFNALSQPSYSPMGQVHATSEIRTPTIVTTQLARRPYLHGCPCQYITCCTIVSFLLMGLISNGNPLNKALSALTSSIPVI